MLSTARRHDPDGDTTWSQQELEIEDYVSEHGFDAAARDEIRKRFFAED